MKIFERDLSKPFPHTGTRPTRIDRRAAYLRRKRIREARVPDAGFLPGADDAPRPARRYNRLFPAVVAVVAALVAWGLWP